METYTLELTDEELRKLVSLKKFFNFYEDKHETVTYQLFKQRIYSGRYTIKRALETPVRVHERSTRSPEYKKWEAIALENGVPKDAFLQRVKAHKTVPLKILAIVPYREKVKDYIIEHNENSKEDDTTIRTIKYYLEQGIPLNQKHRAYYEAHKEEFQ